MPRTPYRISAARPDDVGDLLRLIVSLAEYERLEHLVVCTKPDLSRALFGEDRSVEAILLRPEGSERAVGFALYFHNFSTFLGRRGLYLEDLFVEPDERGNGYGRALLVRLAQIAQERGCGRFEWSVLDWNVDAQRFYESLGAAVLPDWRITRVAGEGIAKLAALT